MAKYFPHPYGDSVSADWLIGLEDSAVQAIQSLDYRVISESSGGRHRMSRPVTVRGFFRAYVVKSEEFVGNHYTHYAIVTEPNDARESDLVLRFGQSGYPNGILIADRWDLVDRRDGWYNRKIDAVIALLSA